MKFTLPKPPSINRLYATNRYTGGKYVTAVGKAWFEEAGWAIRSQYTGKQEAITTSCEVFICLHTCKFQDTDNILKATFDLLEDMKVLENDNLIYKHTMERIKVKHKSDEKLEIFINSNNSNEQK